MSKLKDIFAGDRPGKKVMEEMVIQLTYIYPTMFRECEGLCGNFQQPPPCNVFKAQVKPKLSLIAKLRLDPAHVQAG